MPGTAQGRPPADGAHTTRRQGPRTRHGWRWRSTLGAGLLGTVLAAGPGLSAAQELTVRPREMATGTHTEKAGVFPMPGGTKLYVPPKCVGTQRCPLWINPPDDLNRLARVGADEFGILLLAQGTEADLDSTLKEVLAQFAVAPDKIAITGSESDLAFTNPDVFPRLVTFIAPSWFLSTPGYPGRGPRAEIFQDNGVTDDYHFTVNALVRLADMRKEGYRSKQWFGLHAHGYSVKDNHGYGGDASYHFAMRWLHESWSNPDPAKRPRPTVIDPLPLLAPTALTQMITFWQSFQQEPDSILGTVRQAHLRELAVPVGPQEGWPSTGMVDMASLAAAVPSVAAKLKAAGLTAQQHDAYRLALLSALFLATAQSPTLPAEWDPMLLGADPNSVLGKNVAFVLAHPDELLALEQTAIWMTP